MRKAEYGARAISSNLPATKTAREAAMAVFSSATSLQVGGGGELVKCCLWIAECNAPCFASPGLAEHEGDLAACVQTDLRKQSRVSRRS